MDGEIFHHGKSVAIHPRNFRRGRFSTPAGTLCQPIINLWGYQPGSMIEWASKIGPQTANLVKATLQSRPFPEQAYRSCLGILSLARNITIPCWNKPARRF